MPERTGTGLSESLWSFTELFSEDAADQEERASLPRKNGRGGDKGAPPDKSEDRRRAKAAAMGVVEGTGDCWARFASSSLESLWAEWEL